LEEAATSDVDDDMDGDGVDDDAVVEADVGEEEKNNLLLLQPLLLQRERRRLLLGRPTTATATAAIIVVIQATDLLLYTATIPYARVYFLLLLLSEKVNVIVIVGIPRRFTYLSHKATS
jgi:hypothetical protein